MTRKTFTLDEIKVGDEITLYSVAAGNNTVFKYKGNLETPKDEVWCGRVRSIEGDTVNLVNHYVTFFAGQPSRENDETHFSKKTVQEYIDKGACYLHIHEPPMRTWT